MLFLALRLELLVIDKVLCITLNYRVIDVLDCFDSLLLGSVLKLDNIQIVLTQGFHLVMVGPALLNVQVLLHGNVPIHALGLGLAPNLGNSRVNFLFLDYLLQFFTVLSLHKLLSRFSFANLAIVLLSLLADDGSPLIHVTDAVSGVVALLLRIQVLYGRLFHLTGLFDAVRVKLERVVLASD